MLLQTLAEVKSKTCVKESLSTRHSVGVRDLKVTGAGPSVTFIPAQLDKVSKDSGVRRGDISEGPSESSAIIDTEEETFQRLPGQGELERFFEQMAAKAQLPGPPGTAPSNWVLSLARSYRHLSKDKRRRSRLQALLPVSKRLEGASGSLLAGPVMENAGCTSNTDDSGYEAGYETDADESELSEWESARAGGARVRQGHKRKLEALVHLTMQLSFSEHGDDDCEEEDSPPPSKRALATSPVGLRCSLNADVPGSTAEEPQGEHDEAKVFMACETLVEDAMDIET